MEEGALCLSCPDEDKHKAPAGALINRWDRKRVMILCDTARAISLGSIPLAFAIGHLTLLQL